MGMDHLMLSCIRALAENRIQDAKQAAIACCVNDTTKKNAGKTGYYKKLLENGTTTLFELPANLKGLILMQDVSDFNESRYYLGAQQRALYGKIKMGVDVTTKMLAYGIPYTNRIVHCYMESPEPEKQNLPGTLPLSLGCHMPTLIFPA